MEKPRTTIKKDFKTDEVEIVEEENFGEIEAAKGPSPLVNGYRNKTVIFPLSIMQKRVDGFEEKIIKMFQDFQQQTTSQVKYVFQYAGQIAKRITELELASEAMARLGGWTDDALEVEIENIKAEKAEVQEAETDKQQGLTVVNRAAEKGDVVKIDYVGTIDGKEFDGGEAKGHQLKLGEGTFIPGFENQLVGLMPGDKKLVEVTFPKDYAKKDLAGKSAEFKTRVVKVKEHTPPKKEEEPKAE